MYFSKPFRELVDKGKNPPRKTAQEQLEELYFGIGSKMMVSDVTRFEDNVANGTGEAILLQEDSKLRLEGTPYFVNNTASGESSCGPVCFLVVNVSDLSTFLLCTYSYSVYDRKIPCWSLRARVRTRGRVEVPYLPPKLQQHPILQRRN